MSKAKSRKYVEEYESDDGFVEDAPKSKKARSDVTAGSKPTVSGTAQTDDEGHQYWEISGKRRVNISDFKGATFVGIREFYEKDGKALPGKKGISLSIDQYKAFVELLPQIENVLGSKGIDIPRPKYDEASGSKTEKAENDGDDDVEEAEAPERFKQNHEATSDEEDQ